MKTTLPLLLVGFMLMNGTAQACGLGFVETMLDAALAAAPEHREAKIADLRSMGAFAVPELVRVHDRRTESDPDQGDAIRTVIDAVAQQKDAVHSGLFWHTELDQAQELAQRLNLPILSLRLLGNLDEELTCANSRFFRTLLYPDPTVKEALSTQYVLHWESVRPVPVITIDMGDGRTIERTITGNSIHYVLDAQGRVVDALPGLYSPTEFLRQLDAVYAQAVKMGALDDAPFANQLAALHRARQEAMSQEVDAHLAKAGIADDARSALIGKWETGTLTQTDLPPATWHQLANSMGGQQTVPLLLVAEKKATAWDAGRLAVSKAFVEDPMLKAMRGIRDNVAMDTATNEILLHQQVRHLILDREGAPWQLAALNHTIYETLFLMPPQDPWLGLARPDAYAALPRNGLSE